jgi:hypothetical protein
LLALLLSVLLALLMLMLMLVLTLSIGLRACCRPSTVCLRGRALVLVRRCGGLGKRLSEGGHPFRDVHISPLFPCEAFMFGDPSRPEHCVAVPAPEHAQSLNLRLR